jgi:hypothetical protein
MIDAFLSENVHENKNVIFHKWDTKLNPMVCLMGNVQENGNSFITMFIFSIIIKQMTIVT